MLAQKLGLSLPTIKTLGAAWAPDDEATLEAWYKNATGINLSGTDVDRWSDVSTNSYHMSQYTAAAQPAYSGGVLTFDGVDDNLASGQMNFPAGDELTIGIRGDFSSGVGTLLGDDDQSTSFIRFQSTTVLRIRPLAGPADFTLSSGAFGNGYIVITRDASDNVDAYYNGAAISATVVKGGTIKIDNMGSYDVNDFFDGTILECQIYTSTSAALTANVNNYLSNI
tara:strand:- start:409 stop:1083 length:675 start_codon:yes stop_codon:yes gene_type:complete